MCSIEKLGIGPGDEANLTVQCTSLYQCVPPIYCNFWHDYHFAAIHKKQGHVTQQQPTILTIK